MLRVELENIRAENPKQFMRAWRMLQCWKHRHGRDANSEVLHKRLIQCNRKDLAARMSVLPCKVAALVGMQLLHAFTVYLSTEAMMVDAIFKH